MAPSPTIEQEEEFAEFLRQHLNKELLRFTTAGSVDDGKSTLIGRLLYDAKGVYEDQLASVKKSRVNRSTGPIDFSLLTDGLRAEREQGITIDVAYRYFSTPKRKFIIADTPGHEQYTRNMATGASTADLAVVLIDATKGLLPQTRRHVSIASLLGIRNLLAAINKMDLVEFREDVFLRLQDDFYSLAGRLGVAAVECVPICALAGDNVVAASERTSWYSGPTFLGHLENVAIPSSNSNDELRFPIQSVVRPDASFRGFAGQLASGILRPGDTVQALPSGQTAQVRSIVTFDGELSEAGPRQSVSVQLVQEIDLSRGDMLVKPDSKPAISSRFAATLVWFDAQPLEIARTYLAKHTTRYVKAQVTRIRHCVDVNSSEVQTASQLSMNDIAEAELETSSPLFFDPYQRNRTTGSFILIDPVSNATLAAGMIRENLSPRTKAGKTLAARLASLGEVVSLAERCARHGHSPAIFLLPKRDGLARLVERALFHHGFEVLAIEAETLPPASLLAVLRSLWASGFVVVLSGGMLESADRTILKTIAGESLFEFRNLAEDDERAVEEILVCAEAVGRLNEAGGNGKGDGRG